MATRSAPGSFGMISWTPPRTIERPPREVMDAVQRSCELVADRPVRLAEVFYKYLFELAPSTRSLFKDDMSEQMQNMTTTLLTAISQLAGTDTADLEVLLQRMGADHYRRHRVQPEHYGYVGHALTRAVRDVSKWHYDGYLSSCWVALTQWVTAQMITGARRAMAEERAARQRLAAAETP